MIDYEDCEEDGLCTTAKYRAGDKLLPESTVPAFIEVEGAHDDGTYDISVHVRDRHGWGTKYRFHVPEAEMDTHRLLSPGEWQEWQSRHFEFACSQCGKRLPIRDRIADMCPECWAAWRTRAEEMFPRITA